MITLVYMLFMQAGAKADILIQVIVTARLVIPQMHLVVSHLVHQVKVLVEGMEDTQ
jgi:hypothetical protein